VRYTLTPEWDRSPESLAFSQRGNHLYLTVGDQARVKIFVIPVPPTPKESSVESGFQAHYTTPVELTHAHASSAVQPLSNGRLLFTQSSLTSPNDVFILRDLDRIEEDFKNQETVVYREQPEQITHLTEDALKGKHLANGEDFWFEGADNKDVHGWILKPKGWKEGEKKKWPVLLLIHGGPQSAWTDQWSTRWNPNVFAQQGYFTVAINPTGSTTFGQGQCQTFG
jgi:dipeptidyl aminopeptidase/acylaminoacyl peptidase